MNPDSLLKARRLFTRTARAASRVRGVSVVVCPPTIYLADLAARVRGKSSALGAQDISSERGEGPFTGEVSARMLASVGVSYVIVGHSERRARGETDALVAQKVQGALAGGLVPILCVGERTRDAEGRYLALLERQLLHSLEGVSRREAARLVIAYEPIWAIGKSARDALESGGLHEMVLFIRKTLVRRYGRSVGDDIRILYGGSAEPENSAALARGGGADGFLVGHASLSPESFSEIVASVR